MDATLSVICDDLADSDLQSLTRELSNTIDDETDVDTALPEEVGQSGTRGDAITIGQILLTALSSGTLVAVFNVLRSYFDRQPALELEFENRTGQRLRIRAENLDRSQLDQTIQTARELLRGSE